MATCTLKFITTHFYHSTRRSKFKKLLQGRKLWARESLLKRRRWIDFQVTDNELFKENIFVHMIIESHFLCLLPFFQWNTQLAPNNRNPQRWCKLECKGFSIHNHTLFSSSLTMVLFLLFLFRPEFNFTSQYIVRVDDFFLHYLQKVNTFHLWYFFLRVDDSPFP